jgi:hypothetical protein
MDVMEKAIFYVDFCYEAGSDEYGCNVCGRYKFGLELTDEEYEELYQIWYDQNELNSWSTEWDGHETLYQKINGAAVYALDKYLEQENPVYRNPLDVLWELSQETKTAF